MSIAEAIVVKPEAFPAKDLPFDRPRQSGFVLKPANVSAVTAALKSLYADDENEQRETFEYLKNALNETRAANGERLIFPNEPDHTA